MLRATSVRALTTSKGTPDVKRLSLPALAGGTAVALALGIAAASAVPMGFSQDRSADLAQQINPDKPKSVILIIGDGMDDSMITAARNYSKGAAGRLALDELPFSGAMTTYGLKVGPAPRLPDRLRVRLRPDRQRLVDRQEDRRRPHLAGSLDRGHRRPATTTRPCSRSSRRRASCTGDVSTAEITDATPAAAASHINARACQGPTDMAACPAALKSAGGIGSIAEQLVDNKVDVLLGGGTNRYAKTLEDGSETVLSYAQTKKGYRSVDDRDRARRRSPASPAARCSASSPRAT